MKRLHSFACLLGNGVSLAYNPALAVPALSQELVNRFGALGATEAAKALGKLAQLSAGGSGVGFEAMLGPIEAAGQAMQAMRMLVPLSSASTINAKVTAAAVFARDVHRIGIATTLGLIAERSAGQGSPRYSSVDELGFHLSALVTDCSKLSIATLNYDGLTHSGMINHGTICDLARGYGSTAFCVVPGAQPISGFPIRTADDFPASHSPLLQLHGSLGWLRSPDTGRVHRFAIEDLRTAKYWGALSDGRTDWHPVVILTDRKERAVAADPFLLAYQLFAKRLETADRWLIAGYGFGDTPVNALLADAWNVRKGLGLNTIILVIDYAPVPSSLERKELKLRVSQATGIPQTALWTNLDGVPGALSSLRWRAWRR